MEALSIRSRPQMHTKNTLQLYVALVLREDSGRVLRVTAPSIRMLRDAVDALLGNGPSSAVFLTRNGNRGEEWGEVSVPLTLKADQEVHVE